MKYRSKKKMWSSINQTLSDLCSSTFWENNSTWNSPDPDFTICFEKTILTWFPCAFLWFFSYFEIHNLLRSSSSTGIPFNFFNVSKLIAIAVLASTSLFDSILYLMAHERYPPVDIYSPLIKLFTFCLFFGLTYGTLKCGVRSSGLLSIFSFLLALCGAPQFRTEWKLLHKLTIVSNYMMNQEMVNIISYFIYYLTVLIVLLQNCFSDDPPVRRPDLTQEDICPEYDSSFLSRMFFFWFDKFAWKGYKTLLNNDNLWKLDHEMRSAQIAKKFELKWNLALNRLRQHRRRTLEPNVISVNDDREILVNEECFTKMKETSIVRPLLETFGSSFLFGFVFRLFHGILNTVNPLILSLILTFVEKKEELAWHGYLYVFLLLIVAIFQVLFFNYHYHKMIRLGLQMRTSLISIIYKKALKISVGARKYFTLGEIVNLMAVDAEKFVTLLVNISLTGVSIVEISISFYFLWDILGSCVLIGVAVLVGFMIGNALIVSKIQKLQLKQMAFKDKRVKLTNEILSGIKVLKLYACEPSFETKVTEIRDKEIAILKIISYLRAWASFTWFCTPVIVSFVTFGAFVLSNEEHVLDPKIAFVSLSLFNVMKYSMGTLPESITGIVQGNVATKRINKFLNSEELDPDAVSHEQLPEPIVIKNSAFSWGGYEEPPVLSTINLKIKQGCLVAVVGPVGSGKSSLLFAILGEMYKQSGSVNTTGTLAYVPQQAWVQNATIMNNITFGETPRSSFYDTILKACALIPDLKIFPNGDQTEIGEKGVNLSGGQKQRISLARAVFSEAETYLLDDPLSAVDAHVAKHIFDNVIGPNGLLKRKTRVLVTHNTTYLPQVDQIIYLRNGMISECGTYNELLKKGGDFANVLSTYPTDQENTRSPEDTPKERGSKYADPIENGQYSARRQSLLGTQSNGGTSNANHNLVRQEEIKTGNVKWAVIVYHLKAMGSITVTMTILSNLLCQVFSVASNYWLSIWSNDGKTSPTTNMTEQYEYLGVYAAFGIGQAFSIITQTIALYIGMLGAAKCLHNSLLDSMLHWPMSTFDRIPSGRIINRFGFDMDILDNTLPSNVRDSLSYVAMIFSSLFVITFNTPIFLGVLLPITGVYCIIQRVYSASSKQLKRLESASKSPIYSHFGDTIAGSRSIRAYNLQTKFMEESAIKVDTSLTCSYIGWIANRWLSVRLELLGATIVFTASLFAILAKHKISTALIGLSISYAFQVTRSLFLWIRKTSEVEMNVVAIERVKEYSEIEREAPWIQPITDSTIPENWPSKGEIVFENFRVRYQENSELVLNGISFKVTGSEKVGIVGRTGAGKSSLTLSLFRIIESAGGSILIDDVDVSKIGLHTLRSRLSIIPQDPPLFSGTLRMNLDPTTKYSDEDIWRVLEMANLKTYVCSLNSGLEYEIDEGGSNFSVGQRQLLCLARALLGKTKILILDEATAAVDYETDNFIQATIQEEFKNCTVLTIAHRLNTVLDCDRIMVLDKGLVAEFDSPNTLLESKQSIFYRMALDANLV